MMKDYGHLIAFIAVEALALVAWKIGAPADITGALGIVAGGLVVQMARKAPVE